MRNIMAEAKEAPKKEVNNNKDVEENKIWQLYT
jgi:hypothetical protein